MSGLILSLLIKKKKMKKMFHWCWVALYIHDNKGQHQIQSGALISAYIYKSFFVPTGISKVISVT